MLQFSRVKNLLDPNNQSSFNQRFRKKRFQFFLKQLETLGTDKCITILDIGGVEAYWVNMGIMDAKFKLKIILLNLQEVNVSNNIFSSVAGDARDLSQYQDKSIDVVYSNSVIEHLFKWENQVMMANEVTRVGKNYFVQTPNYWFPVEPHWLFPFFQFLPHSFRVWLTQNFSFGHYKKTGNYEVALKRVNEVQLLTVKEMKRLFPVASIYKERFFGFIKSITAYNFSVD